MPLSLLFSHAFIRRSLYSSRLHSPFIVTQTVSHTTLQRPVKGGGGTLSNHQDVKRGRSLHGLGIDKDAAKQDIIKAYRNLGSFTIAQDLMNTH